jgi:hypothetical protein
MQPCAALSLRRVRSHLGLGQALGRAQALIACVANLAARSARRQLDEPVHAALTERSLEERERFVVVDALALGGGGHDQLHDVVIVDGRWIGSDERAHRAHGVAVLALRLVRESELLEKRWVLGELLDE